MHQDGISQRLLTAAEERSLAHRVHGSDEADATLAAQTLTLRNLGLVGAAVGWYCERCPRLDREDAFGEGMLALVEASRLYNPEYRGVRFSTYACKAIHNRICDWIMLDRTVHVPIHLQREFRRAGALGAMARTMSLGQDGEIGDDRTAPADRAPLPLEAMVDHEDLGRIWSALALINPVYSYVIVYRYGLGGHERRTLDRLAGELDMTREGVRLMEGRAVRKLAAVFFSGGRQAEICA